MSRTFGKIAGPSPVLSKREGDADTSKTEQAIVKDVLRQLPSLNKHSPSPPAADTRGARAAETAAGANSSLSSSHHISHSDLVDTLGADDEELLLQELLSITAGAAPFVSSKTAAASADAVTSSNTGQGDAPSPVHAVSSSTMSEKENKTNPADSKASSTTASSAEVGRNSKQTLNNATRETPTQIAKPSAAGSPTTAIAANKKKSAFTSREEQDILDAILTAVDDQQSSVSGDLTSSKPTSAAQESARKQPQRDEEQDAVDRVLEEAKLLATSTVLCETQRGELVLHIHEHVALRRQLTELNKTIGAPTCVALTEAAPQRTNNPSSSSHARPSSSAKSSSLAVAVGTNLGAVALFDQRWSLLGLCGSVEASVVHVRGAVVSLSLSATTSSDETNEEPTAATGHATGVCILWSLNSFSPLRIIKDECTVPVLRLQHLHRDTTRFLMLASNGAVKLFQLWKVMSKHVLRSTTLTATAAATPISDVDALPYPSSFYMRNLPKIKDHLPAAATGWNTDNGIPWLLAPPPLPSATAGAAGVSRTRWSTVADKHLVAAVSNDAVLIYIVEAGLQGAVTGVARHTHPPSSALSNELVRFVPMEQEGVAPRVLLCVSWNTEIELLFLNLRLPDTGSSVAGASGSASDPLAQGVERIALLRLAAPLLQMVPLAGCSVLLLDQNKDAQLMDASVAVMVERHHFASLEYVTFVSRLCGTKYHGTLASNQSAALLLGKGGHAYGISLYSWRERLTTLVARRKFAEALDLAKGFAEEVALSMVGLSSNTAQRRRDLHQYMERILFAYLESTLSDSTPSSAASENAADSLLDVLQGVAAYCSTVDALDLLYGPITRTLQQRGLLSYLLYALEGTMRHGIITYMPEPLIERFIDFFLRESELAALEVALGVRPSQQRQAAIPHKQSASPTVASAGRLGSPDVALSGKDRAELALMCLDAGLPNLLRLAREHKLLRLSVTIMSYRQQQYVEALAYALDEEEGEAEEERAASADTIKAFAGSTSASVAVDLVEYTLKDCALLPGADIPANEQRPAKKALLEFLLQTNTQGQHNLLRFLQRWPQHAVRVLLFALSDEGLCSPWGSSRDGFCRTQFVSSVFFLLTGGTRTQPRPWKSGSEERTYGRQESKPVNLFLIDDEALARTPGLRKLCAAELAERSFPPYDVVHTFLSDAAFFDELFLADGENGEVGGKNAADGFSVPVSTPSMVRFDVWMDLVLQDALYMFQNAQTAEERRALQERLMSVMAPPFIPQERIAVFQPDFTRLRMARCLAALFCKEQRYTEAIRCYIDPAQNSVDPSLQRDVFGMLRSEMQRLQDLKTRTANAAEQLSASRRFESDTLDGTEMDDNNVPASPSSGAGRHTSNSAMEPLLTSSSSLTTTAAATSAIDAAIKALQRGVMSQVEALVRIDATALAQFIFDYLPSNHREVMRLLRGSSAAFLDYLDELIAQGDPTVANDINLQNTYIELLCAHAPDRVFAHLQEKGSSITYDVQLALRAVRKYHIADASIYLLEKTMMIQEAMTVMVSATRAALANVREEVIAQLTAETDSHATAKQEALKHSFASASTVSAAANAASTSTTTTTAVNTVAVAAGGKNPTAAHSASSGAIPDFLMDATAVRGAATLLRLITIGKTLCQKYQVDRLSGDGGAAGGAGSPFAQNPEYWFRLLDVFMVPRRLLCQVVTKDEQLQSGSGGGADEGNRHEDATMVVDGTGMQSELEIAANCAAAEARSDSPRSGRDGRRSASSPLLSGAEYRLPRLTRPLTPHQRKMIAALVSVYTQCTSDVLRGMMNSLDLSVVVDKVVQDNKEEAFRPFKPVILDMMASLSFELEANRLCESATESDVMSLGRELYQKLNTGIVTLSDSCALCHVHLSEPPPAFAMEATLTPAAVAPASSPSSAVSVYMCGHAYHTLCSQHVMNAAPQQQGGGCYVCAQQRFLSTQPGTGVAGVQHGSGGGVVGAGASEGPATTSLGNRSARQPASVDIARTQRRVRQTKVKIDHTEDLYPLLKSYLTWGDSAPSTPAGNDSAAAAAVAATASGGPSQVAAEAGSWVLAPSPRVPAAIGDLATSSQGAARVTATGAGSKGFDVETLTDAEILELFGTL
ncbi:hypothetical protein ABB37_03901 [Leptomonas pyrrhocoris]|uniref:RING-type domain-containing protein n=1 Tax=Leptomonas pyrrhocoris TaxID=157538 RepID=A0A0N0VFL5_LEPPY|nr:hypothetical protein ABB37_03901 [Leptomonas pyrrhocoris]KPA81558.1 hypothetical protein ABB37_03901 [Leptomonas pyrrhocoris]|eukprot:XP_015659997.1 hypothetical protein ABB37_03901 [Leptomonas pyrrhocoris]